jgi:CarD family transcriptional regulator
MRLMEFNIGNYVVYPAHGVGKIVGYENSEVAGHVLELMIIEFEKEKMVLRLPSYKAKNAGLRKLSSKSDMEQALNVLSVKTKSRRTMWSRRAHEYESKINSGMPSSIAEVIRDLHRRSPDSEQSYSERHIYQAALERLVRELAIVEEIAEDEAFAKVEKFLRAA